MRYHLVVFLLFLSIFILDTYIRYSHYTIPKSEYNELTQDGKVWAYVRKDGKL